MSTCQMEIYEKLKKIRNAVNLSQPKFSELVDIPVSSYRRYEQNQSEMLVTNLEKILSHPEFQKYVLWFMTGKTNPSVGQIAPGDAEAEEQVEQQALAQVEFDQQFMKVVEDSMLMFCHLGWFEVKFTKEDKIDFDTCSSLILKDMKPVLQKMPQQQQNLHLVNKTG